MTTPRKSELSPPQTQLANASTRHHSSPQTRPRKDTVMSAYGLTRPAVSPPLTPLSEFPSSRAFALPPCRGRTMWAVPVLRCVWCGSGHVHRTGDTDMLLAGKLVRRCPTTGRLYRLGPVQRRNEPRRTIHLPLAA